MARFFLGISPEQYSPESLMEQAQAGARAGFDGLSIADHLQPWWEPAEAAHAWPLLGALGARVEGLPFGTGVTPPGPRYHPALIVQAWATLERLYPGRPFLGLGSGEALNEVPVGDDWPSPGDQVARLDEACEIMDRLWQGERLTFEGRFFTCKDCKVHTLAERRPEQWISAFGPKAAEVAGRWGQGLWTLGEPESAPDLIDTYREAGGDGEIVLQAQSSWAATDEDALAGIEKWKSTQVDEAFTEDWHIPNELLEHARSKVSDEDLRESAIVSADPAEHVRRLRELVDLGGTVIVVQNNSGLDPLGAIETYGKEILPALR
jgi:coenzyme F420-dependent glucose-6-phosphate dehydrogenase